MEPVGVRARQRCDKDSPIPLNSPAGCFVISISPFHQHSASFKELPRAPFVPLAWWRRDRGPVAGKGRVGIFTIRISAERRCGLASAVPAVAPRRTSYLCRP